MPALLSLGVRPCSVEVGYRKKNFCEQRAPQWSGCGPGRISGPVGEQTSRVPSGLVFQVIIRRFVQQLGRTLLFWVIVPIAVLIVFNLFTLLAAYMECR